ncbi:VPS13p-like protein [Cryptosporidium canis]|uniref:VPS13p-like protein n=1 Tax=Cryptosporidium canis TaxID=195482 RepID=A0ABQ8P4J7_9CRYT|nr:VPS13p-like protein [Cryptosporidium canis]
MRRAVSRVAGFVSKWATAFIGKYLENVSEDSFELGLSSGRLQLRNVRIKEGFLEQLRLPIRLKHGCIETINISIPYSNILRPGSSSPLVVEIDDVNLSASFMDESEFDSERVESLVISERLRLIEHWNIQFMAELAEDEYFTVRGTRGKGESKPFLSRIVSVLIQDVRLKFRRVHIRLEDSTSKVLNCGLVLDSLEVRSIPNLSQVLEDPGLAGPRPAGSAGGELGPDQIHGYEEHLGLVKAIFGSRSDCSDERLFEPFFQKKDSSDFSYRILDLDGLSMYVRSGAAEDEASARQVPKELGQVVHPFCCKLLLRQRRDLFSMSKMPIYTVYGVLEEIYVTISEQIIAYCGRILGRIQAFNKQIDLGKVSLERRFLYRPSVPVIGNTRLWWKYAIGCVIRDRRVDISAISGPHRFPSSACGSSAYIRLQEDFTEAKISMYCKEYTLEFNRYFQERMTFDSIGPYFDGDHFNDLLLAFSRQFSEYYILRIPFSRFVSLHTSLVHQWVGKRLEIHSFRRATQADSHGSGSWVQWLFNLHRISSVPLHYGQDVFFDAREAEAEAGDEHDPTEDDAAAGEADSAGGSHENASVEFDESFVACQPDGDPQFFDCVSDHSGEEGGPGSPSLDRLQLSESSPGVRQFGSISSETPFMAFRVLLREAKLEVILASGDSGDATKSALVGIMKNFGLEFIQSDSRISLLSVLQEFTLDYSGPGREESFHVIYEDESLVEDDKMWFTFYYLSRKSPICDVQGSSRRRASLSLNSDFSLDRSIPNRVDASFAECSRTTVRINVEKCYVIFYSNVISALVHVINKYNKSISRGGVEGPRQRPRGSRESHAVGVESGSTDLDAQEGDAFLQNSGLVDVDIQIETPILVFCHRTDPGLDGVIYNVISFGKISISNNDSYILRGCELEEGSVDLSGASARPESTSLDLQSLGKGGGGPREVQVSPYYRYVLSEKSTYWFKCVQSLCYYIRVEEIYLSLYSDVQYGPSKPCREDQRSRIRVPDRGEAQVRPEKRTPRLPKGVEMLSSYRLFSIDCIDIKLNLLLYKKYNMLDETWIKYVKLFGVLTQLGPFSEELFEERSFMSLVLSTNSVCLDSRPGGGGSVGEIQLGDVLRNVYSSIQVNSVTSNFDPRVYQSIYQNILRWMDESCLSEYFNLGRKLTREKEFRMFKLGLNVQLFWFLRLNSVSFDLVSGDGSWMNAGMTDVLVLSFIHDHYRFVNLSISQLFLDHLSGPRAVGGPGPQQQEDSPHAPGAQRTPLFSLGSSCSFVRLQTPQHHFIEELHLVDAEDRRPRPPGRPRPASPQCSLVQIKAEVGSASVYLRPQVLQELISLFARTASPYLGSAAETGSKRDQSPSRSQGQEIGMRASEGSRRYSVSARVRGFELVAFQRDCEFFRLAFENTVSVCDQDTRREIAIQDGQGLQRLGLLGDEDDFPPEGPGRGGLNPRKALEDDLLLRAAPGGPRGHLRPLPGRLPARHLLLLVPGREHPELRFSSGAGAGARLPGRSPPGALRPSAEHDLPEQQAGRPLRAFRGRGPGRDLLRGDARRAV